MPTRKGGGARPGVRDLTIEILKQIRDGVHTTNARIDDLRSEMHTELGALRSEMHTELGALRSEVGQLRSDTSAALARHEQAIGGLVREVKGLNERFDNFLTGTPLGVPYRLARSVLL